MRTPLRILCFLVAASSATLTQAEELSDLIAANRSTFQLTEGRLEGDGSRFLIDEAKRAEMFLIAEAHGNRETPELTDALLPTLRTAGYGAFAIETGPHTAELLTELAADPAGAEAFKSYLENKPLTFPFFWWREEAELLRSATKLGYQLWGLDQEFVAADRFLLEKLAGRLDGPAREEALTWLGQAKAAFAKFLETGDSDAGFINQVDPVALRAFAERLAGDAESQSILEELAATAVVYQHYGAKRYFENNRDRIILMKRHFLTYLEAAGGLAASPKVLLKFGAAHMGRGYSPFDQLDLGNQAAELSFARGGDSFHLLVAARHFAAPDGTKQDLAQASPYLSLFDPHLAETGWTVFDLRPLRARLSARSVREKHPELAAAAFRYDAIAIAPLFHPADAMVPLPFG